MVLMLLIGIVVIGTHVTAILLDWEYGILLSLFGFLFVLGGMTVTYYQWRRFLHFRKYFVPPDFVRCPYRGMTNSREATFCLRCGKALQRKLNRTSRNL